MCDSCSKDCIVCGCPIVEDEEKGEGCINGSCPTNKDEQESSY